MAINFNKFTIKAQEALQSASEIASNYSNQQVEVVHLFAALIENNENITVSLLKKIGAETNSLKIKTSSFIEKLPKITTGGANQYLSQELSKTLDESFKFAGQLRDEYVGVEHILIAICESNTEIGKYLREIGISKY